MLAAASLDQFNKPHLYMKTAYELFRLSDASTAWNEFGYY